MKKTLITIIVSIITISAIILYIAGNIYRSKASGEVIRITMTSADGNMTLPAGTSKIVNVDITPLIAGTKISGFDLNFLTVGNMVIEKIDPALFVGGDNSFLTEVVRAGNRVSYVIKKSDAQLPSAIRVPVTVKAVSPGEARLKIDYSTDLPASKTQVVGNVSNYLYSFGTSPVSVDELVFNPGQGTPTVQGNSNLNIKLRFQGITGALADTFKTMPVKITLKKEPNIIVTTSIVNFTVDNNGIWQGVMPVTVEAGVKYSVLAKGLMHIQKRICDLKPVESTVGSYRCSNPAIILNVGTVAAPVANELDFSGITLLVGDLPLSTTNGQDNVSDAADIGYIINNFDKKDTDVQKIGDLNRNGGVDATDFGLIKYALSVKVDEE